MLKLREYKTSPTLLTDELVWACLVAPSIVEQKDGLIQTTIRFRGHDLDSSTPEEMMIATARLNNTLKRLQGGWSVFIEAQRNEVSQYPKGDFAHPVAELIDQTRAEKFERGGHFASDYYCTFVYAPPAAKKQSFLNALFSVGTEDASVDRNATLAGFGDTVTDLVSLFSGVFADVERLTDDETLTYLKSTIGTERHPVKTPDVPMYLDAILPTQEVQVGLELRIGRAFVRTMTVRHFPSQTYPGLLDGLNRLGMPYRWVSRYIAYDKTDAVSELKKYQKRWYSQRQGIGSMLSEMVGVQGSALQNSDAVNKASDVDDALQLVSDDLVSVGLLTTTLTVWGDSREEVDERFSLAKTEISSRGFSVIDETFNAKAAWLSSHPGNVYANIRRPLIHTLNLAHLLPTSAIWSGSETHTHFDGPAHIITSSGTTPFRLNTNVGDVGHTLILGPTGAGKSAFLALLELQFLKYKDAQVFVFDKGSSAKAATYGVGGDFFEVSPGGSGLVFQPFRDVHVAKERTFAHGWVLGLLAGEGIEVDARVKELVWNALGEQGVAGYPQSQRTMFALVAALQDVDLRQALEPFTRSGPYGGIFDGDNETLSIADWTTFEMETLMQHPQIVAPTLTYLFHRVEQRFDGRPTMLVLDEAWMFLSHPMFATKIREWLKVLRKKNVYVVFATQSIADAVNSEIAPAILENCLTRIFLPNARALEPASRIHYEKLGLNTRQIKIVATGTPKRQYYFQSQDGCRLFDLALSELELAFCGASSPKDLKSLDQIRSRYDVDGFPAAWLRHCGLHREADQVMDMAGRGVANTIQMDADASALLQKAWEQQQEVA